jgi:hypothetical protein
VREVSLDELRDVKRAMQPRFTQKRDAL